MATLYHADLHKRNIFVSDEDPTVVTDLIDWQSSSIEPAFEYADETPDFAVPIRDEALTDQSAVTTADLCSKAFEICLHFCVPKVSAARALDQSLVRPFRYCHRTWRDSAVAFRQELIDISSCWNELGLADSCPYPLPTSDELLVHQKDVKSLETVYELRHNLMSLLNTSADGWVSTESWEVTKVVHKEAFDVVIQAVENSEEIDEEPMSGEDVRRIWPFDIV